MPRSVGVQAATHCGAQVSRCSAAWELKNMRSWVLRRLGDQVSRCLAAQALRHLNAKVPLCPDIQVLRVRVYRGFGAQVLS